MRPLKLEMCAWGPYPDKIFIDFEAVGKNHIFLLTGPTGAGKTTIFDGITYGLYGNVSGQYREKARVRSDFASPDIETYVELKFSHKGKIYVIRRSPRFDRPKKRGEGTITCPEQADLYMPDGQIISGVTAVTQTVKQLMSIDYQQFKQISMIAQGEFLELLFADSEKRVEIFRNIFNTEGFHKIQLRFAEQSKQLFAKISELKVGMDTSIASISTDNDQLKACMNQEHPDVRSVMEHLKMDNLSDKKSIDDLTAKIYENRKHSEQLAKAAERLSIDYGDLKDKIVRIKLLETSIKKLGRRLETAEKNFATINKYEEETRRHFRSVARTKNAGSIPGKI